MGFNIAAASGAAGIGAGQNPVVLNDAAPDGRAGAQAEVVYIFPTGTACFSLGCLLVLMVTTSSFLIFAASIAAIGLLCIVSKFLQIAPAPSDKVLNPLAIAATASLTITTLAAFVAVFAWPALLKFMPIFSTFGLGSVLMVAELTTHVINSNKTTAIKLSIY